MALETCAACTARYAVGLASCPQCGGRERGDGMAKISRAGVSYGPDDTRPLTPLPHAGSPAPAVPAVEPHMIRDGIAGASGLEVLKAEAEGAEGGVPPAPAPAQTAPRVPPRRTSSPSPPAGA